MDVERLTFGFHNPNHAAALACALLPLCLGWRRAAWAGRSLAALLFVALLLFVGIPIPGTGAWTGTLAASFLNMGIKSTAGAVSLGVVMAGIIMGVGSHTALHVFGL